MHAGWVLACRMTADSSEARFEFRDCNEDTLSFLCNDSCTTPRAQQSASLLQAQSTDFKLHRAAHLMRYLQWTIAGASRIFPRYRCCPVSLAVHLEGLQYAKTLIATNSWVFRQLCKPPFCQQRQQSGNTLF